MEHSDAWCSLQVNDPNAFGNRKYSQTDFHLVHFVLVLELEQAFIITLPDVLRIEYVVVKVLIPKSLENEVSSNFQIWSLFKPIYHPCEKNANLYFF